ncbi:hypothetical protein ABLG96_03605 [Nakamurella sp. A5-74]|uniref:HipA-like C-terminal domain-containing protein n=1 Tax=Nakamurella sp. A5-74 TaxID=3158264 RepID=A0AAU8DRR4_9ACTN
MTGPDETDAWWALLNVSTWPERWIEQGGSNSVRWLDQPDTRRAWLHKNTTILEASGVEQGEDWAEVVASQVAGALGVPCADVRLCVRDGRRGSLSLDVAPRGYSLWPANVWLNELIPDYVPHTEEAHGVDPARPDVKRPGHTLENYRQALVDVGPPPTFLNQSFTGFDVLAGYHVLDALIANRDRHTENWGVLDPGISPGQVLLAPSFDHGGSLGFNLSDTDRESMLTQDRLEEWARRGTAHRLEHRKGEPRASLVDAASRALDLASPAARAWWRMHIMELDLSELAEVLGEIKVPSMSGPACRFTIELLRVNLRRLRDGIGTAG